MERENRMKRMKKFTALSLIMAMFLTVGATPAFGASAAPRVEDVDYEGKGVVEVEFIGKVKYKNVKVTLKDNKGKKYSAKVLKRDRDDIKFRINKYKTGRTYTATISGVKKWSARKYTKVNAKVKIKAVSKKHITAAKAKSVALKNAGLKASQVRYMHVEKDYDDGRYIYEVEFKRGYYEYSYEIHATTGIILDKEIDYDD